MTDQRPIQTNLEINSLTIQSPAAAPKNIIICCDGTGNEYGDRNTNVVKMFRIITKNDPRQVAYYNPGVGTMSLPGILTRPAKGISKLLGMAFGVGFTENLESAYEYLMDRYQDGDRIWLFGFSRGAFTVRALAGMLHKCGLLTRGSNNLIPYASKMYKYERDKEISEGFRRTYCRPVKIHFVGVWDTVKSLGNIYNPLTLAFTMRNPDVEIFRQAISIDERRCFYRQNRWRALDDQDVKEVWFAGVHSDVGGSYPECQSGLSKIALKWLLDEAIKKGLLYEQADYDIIIPKQDAGCENQQVVSRAQAQEKQAAPDHRGMLHKSLKGGWWILEYLPKLFEDLNATPPRKSIKIPGGELRFIPEGSLIHESVIQRMRDVPSYKPRNLMKLNGNYTVVSRDAADTVNIDRSVISR